MEHNEEEAKRAIAIAEKKLSENDYVGAKKFVYKAQNLYPNLDGLKQVLIMINVFISASNNGLCESDWYGILGVDPLADDETVKKQYKKLALLLHPDKNKFNGAEEAFKLVSEAWCLLSDNVQRIAYDQRRISDEGKQEKQPRKREEKDYSDWDEFAEEYMDSRGDKRTCVDITYFWTVCKGCNTYCCYGRPSSLDKTLSCPNCSQDFVATEIIPEMVDGRPVIRFSTPYKRDQQSSDNSQSTSDTSSVLPQIEQDGESKEFDDIFKN